MNRKNKKIKFQSFLLTFAFFLSLSSCLPHETESLQNAGQEGVEHPDWLNQAVLYELNVRQFSQEGTFDGVREDLPRLKDLGVDILWLMPVHPIGVKNRKGELGSYYSVKDYEAVNPEFGTMEDFKELVDAVHEQQMKIIIDWVPNHSSWDNALLEEHPDYYLRDSTGNFVSPFDWTDVVQFDYNNEGLREYMTEAMQFWIRETDIDGFRCDVAHMVPVDFWNDLRPELMKIKEIFMLAESDQPFLHEEAFDATYDWKLHHIMNEVAQGSMDAEDIKAHFTYIDTAYPPNSILLEFTSNHDENSWNGTVFERLGEAAETFAVFTFTIEGMPLIYNGQEACLDKRLEFFQRDPIEWSKCDFSALYRRLNALRDNYEALNAGSEGGEMEICDTEKFEDIFAFKRTKDDITVISIFNFSDTTRTFIMPSDVPEGRFADYFSGEKYNELQNAVFSLPPWGYNILAEEAE